MAIRAEIAESGSTIELLFPYSTAAVKAVKAIPGARFVPPERGGPSWRIPLTLKSARLMRETFGLGIKHGPNLRAWGKAAVREERELKALAMADDGQLERLPRVLPVLAAALYPYQRADVAFMARNNLINANEPGLGKTLETIAATHEMEPISGARLVLAPSTALRSVWQAEIERWTSDRVLTGDTPDARRAAISRASELALEGLPFWLLLNTEMARLPELMPYPNQAAATKANNARIVLDALTSIDWDVFVVDEFHKAGLREPKSSSHMAMALIALSSFRRFALSGTPTGGVPLNLWGVLHWLSRQQFGSKWQWAKAWLQVNHNGFGHDIGGILPGRERQFYESHSPYLIRRTKGEVLPELPPKQYVDVWCEMTPKQAKQYAKMEADAEMVISGQRVAALSVLAEYTRLRQIAGAACQIRDGKIHPTTSSGKLTPLLENVRRRVEAGEQVVVASQFSKMCDLLAGVLRKEGYGVKLITGKVKTADRTETIADFQAEGSDIDALVICTHAGGVAITVDKADSMHVIDETWDPDDQVQLEDRIHRASRMHQVTIYNYRTKDTIEEAIEAIGINKAITAATILDVHRKIKKAAASSRA